MDAKQSESKPAPSRGSVDQSLVDIFGTKDDSEAMVVQGLLDSAGIDSVLVSLDAPQEVLPGVGGVVIRVAPEQAEQAKRLIEEYSLDGEKAADEAEEDSEINGGSAA